ncbi:MAG: HAD hydrolase-like protein [bacterium]|nr:HAD hydrolase-like protein [bacterium]
MNPSIKFVYLDIGDTLVAKAKPSLVMKALGLKEEVFKNAYQKFRVNMHKGKSSPSDFIESLKDDLIMPKEDALKKWNAALKNLAVIEPMHKLVKDLKIKYKIGLLTNIFPGHFELFYNAGKIPHLSYDVIIKSCDVGSVKPEKEIYEISAKKSQVAPKEILFIDNEKEYVDAAIKYGWQGYVFDPKNPDKSAEELRNILL